MEGLSEVRAGVLRRPGLVGTELRAQLTDAYDAWLRELFASVVGPGETSGVALVAVGGLGRRETAPFSDLDLVLLHRGTGFGAKELASLADSIWYPIWDSKLGLDHSVRSPEEALDVARSDIKAMLGLLDLRHVAGDTGVSGPVRQQIFDLWRTSAPKRLPELREISQARWAISGEGAFLLEPNLKDSRGGLRDAQSLHAFAAAQLVDVPYPAREASALLLDVRGELHRRTGRNSDVLRLQEQAGVAEALDLGRDEDVLSAVNQAARTISLALDNAWRRVAAAEPVRRSRLRFGPFASPALPERVGLANGVVRQSGEVVLARDADPWADPILVLRVARAAAENDLPIAPFALERLATEAAPLPIPWPEEALADFVAVLGAGHRGVPVMEALDQAGLLVRLIPEWDAVRFKAQHNPVHRFTVDRHLLETAAGASELTRSVSRPDLLLLGALFHDIGKGFEGDHSVVGAHVTEKIASRLGLTYGDGATVTALVRHHLLLPDTATRRDPDDVATIRIVREAVSDSAELLDLLHALTIADAAATGPGVWSEWKAGLISELVRRTRSVLSGSNLPPPPPLDERRRKLADKGALAVEIAGDEVVVAAPDALGVLSKAAGVLALHSLDVRSASIHTYNGMAVNAFVVDPRFGTMPDASLVRTDLTRAIDGVLPLGDRLTRKEAAYARTPTSAVARRPATVHWFDDEATDATVLELRADDALGLLFRVTSALERCGVDVRGARVSSLGGSVVDAFYLTKPDGSLIPAAERPAIEAAVLGS